MSFYLGFEPTEKESGFVFVSYSHKDTEIVRQYAEKLHSFGIEIWYDKGIRPFDDFKDEIIEKISACSCFVAFISNNFALSEHCIKETGWAADNKKKCMPTFIERVVSLPNKLQYDISSTNYFEAFECESVYQAVAVMADGINRATSKTDSLWSEWKGTGVRSSSSSGDVVGDLVATGYTWLNHYKTTGTETDLNNALSRFEEATKKSPSDPRGWLGYIEATGEDKSRRHAYVELLSKIDHYFSYIDAKQRDSYNSQYNDAISKTLQYALDYNDLKCSRNAQGAAAETAQNAYLEYISFLEKFTSSSSNRHIDLPFCAEIKEDALRKLDITRDKVKIEKKKGKKETTGALFKKGVLTKNQLILYALIPVCAVVFAFIEAALVAVMSEKEVADFLGEVLPLLSYLFDFIIQNRSIALNIWIPVLTYVLSFIINVGTWFLFDFVREEKDIDFVCGPFILNGELISLGVGAGLGLLGGIASACSDTYTISEDITMALITSSIVPVYFGIISVILCSLMAIYAVFRIIYSFAAKGISHSFDKAISADNEAIDQIGRN